MSIFIILAVSPLNSLQLFYVIFVPPLILRISPKSFFSSFFPSGLTAAGQPQAPGSHIPSTLKSVMNLTTRVTSMSFHPSGTYKNDAYVCTT